LTLNSIPPLGWRSLLYGFLLFADIVFDTTAFEPTPGALLAMRVNDAAAENVLY
jgi:hypothetical protein